MKRYPISETHIMQDNSCNTDISGDYCYNAPYQGPVLTLRMLMQQLDDFPSECLDLPIITLSSIAAPGLLAFKHCSIVHNDTIDKDCLVLF